MKYLCFNRTPLLPALCALCVSTQSRLYLLLQKAEAHRCLRPSLAEPLVVEPFPHQDLAADCPIHIVFRRHTSACLIRMLWPIWLSGVPSNSMGTTDASRHLRPISKHWTDKFLCYALSDEHTPSCANTPAFSALSGTAGERYQ